MDSTYDLRCELAVALAERNQADEEVERLTTKVKDLEEWVEELRAKLREWEELEAWRQAHWDELQTELKRLRDENVALRKKDSVRVAKSQ